jgi:hypothetical protein
VNRLAPGASGRRCLSGASRGLVVVAMLALGALSALGASPAPASASLQRGVASAFGVPAIRQPLTTDPNSPVAHDTETDALVSHAGRLFASTDQWEYPGPSPAAGQILVKNSASSLWKVFQSTQGLRVSEALDSFTIPSDQGLGPGHSLLITHAILNGRSVIEWLLDGAKSFSPKDTFPVPSNVVDARSFGAHESGGVWAVYAGVEPTGILRGVWSKTKHTLVFSPTPELAVPKGAPGFPTQKVTGFADCAGALYVSINTKLYRRNDGGLPSGVARWVLVYQEPPVGVSNSGLRGLSCVSHDGAPALLLSTEGNGNVYRLDDLPRGRLDASSSASPGHGSLTPILEFRPIPALRQMLEAEGTYVPPSGKGEIAYVIAAYNNFTTIKVDGVARQFFGIEHAYLGGCLPTRVCGPTAYGAVTFDAAPCFAVRTDDGRSITYSMHCLSGRDFALSGQVSKPIRSGQAFVSIRTIVPSPFGDGRVYFGGYDCNFYPADGTAWVASSALGSVHLDDSKGKTS